MVGDKFRVYHEAQNFRLENIGRPYLDKISMKIDIEIQISTKI